LCLRFESNRREFYRKRRGRLPKDAWVNPPLRALKYGDIVVFSGIRSAAVGHSEWYVRVKGNGMLLSAYFGSGVNLFPATKLIKDNAVNYSWVVRRPVEFSDDDVVRAEKGAVQVKADNETYKFLTRCYRDFILDELPLPEFGRNALRKLFPITGYGWATFLFGCLRARDHFTCAGSYQEVLERIGKPVKWPPVGVIGLGIGPGADNSLDDSSVFRLLTVDDEVAFFAAEAGSNTSAARELLPA
jgi:hypothetical protein